MKKRRNLFANKKQRRKKTNLWKDDAGLCSKVLKNKRNENRDPKSAATSNCNLNVSCCDDFGPANQRLFSNYFLIRETSCGHLQC